MDFENLSHAELLKHAAKIELTNDFIDFCIKYGMFNSEAIRRLDAVQMEEHNPFSYGIMGGFDTAAQHDALRWLHDLHYGAVKWTAYLQQELSKRFDTASDFASEFLAEMEPK